MKIIIFFLGALFLNSFFHELQKLNYYNHVFLHYLQVLELDLKFVAIWKIKLKYLQPLKNDEIVGDIFGVLCQVQMIWHKLLWKAKGGLKMPMQKIKIYTCFEMLEEG
jgi:hypothetical protein